MQMDFYWCIIKNIIIKYDTNNMFSFNGNILWGTGPKLLLVTMYKKYF